MYLDFYQLKKAPFHITPDPDFLFLSPSHKAALGSIIYGIEERQGFVAIIGEVGLGKTTILRSYLERIDQRQLKTIYIFNANISFRSLLKTVFQEFGLDFEADDLFDMVNRLHQVLIEEYKQGRNVALIIDEAQNMPIETLENLRMLSNLETSTEKLVQIVLIGQPEFENKLNLNELRQLKQRVVIRSTIAPLTDEESLTYIEHRLAKVAAAQEPLFTKGALKLITQHAKGTPRALNILCTNTLIAGFGYRQKPIAAGTVKEVIGAIDGTRQTPRLRPAFVWVAGLVTCAAVLWVSPYRALVLTTIVPSQMSTVPTRAAPVETANHTKTPPVTPRQESIPSQSGVIQASAPQDHLRQYVSQGLTHVVHNALSPSLAAEAPKTAEHASNHNSDTRDTLTHPAIQQSVQPSQDSMSEAKKVQLPLTRVMSKGDYISKIAVEVYGYANDEIFALIKIHNPRIKDINRVEVGEKVLFPELQASIR